MLWKLAEAGRDAVVSFAADELKKYVEMIDGDAEVCVLSYRAYEPELSDVLWLGVCPEICARVEDPAYDDSIRVDVERGRGAIRGSNPRSVLIGVYRFLREIGCAWVRPSKDGEILPCRSLDDVSVHIDETPSCRHRGVCIEGAVSYDHVAEMIDWLPKVGMNAYFNQFRSPYTFYDRWYSHKDNPYLKPAPLSSEEIRGLRDRSVAAIKKRGMLYHVAGHGWTCEPFGVPGESWDECAVELTDEQRRCFAEVGGERGLWKGVTLNTQVCFSQKAVRAAIADSVVEYCRENPEIDFVHLWMGDGANNHCECAECRVKRPSDWYVTLLNEVDAKMTAAGLPQKIVFLIYVDLLWEPIETALNHPDRFTLMFAPITRTYSTAFADSEPFDERDLPPYVRNRLTFPRSPGENLAWLSRWKKVFDGDGFDFDYHFMWDHYRDPAYFNMAKILFDDMKNLHKIGLDGMISCQAQRVFFPTGLGMTAMAAALWDENASFDEVADGYFRAAFGRDWEAARDYLRELSDAFDSPYLRGEKPRVDPTTAGRYRSIPAILDRFADLAAKNQNDSTLPCGVRASWKYLSMHGTLCRLLARTYAARAEGDDETAKRAIGEVCEWIRRNEGELNEIFDAFEAQKTYRETAGCDETLTL